MTPILDAGAAHLAAQHAHAALRSQDRDPTYRLTVAWIESLIVAQQAHMTNCGREKLGDAQVRLKQLSAMRSALVDPGGASTGFQFD